MSRILKLKRDTPEGQTGGLMKVVVSRDVLQTFFQKSTRAFQVTKGLPEDAELVDFVYDPKTRLGTAVFTHPFWPANQEGLGVPTLPEDGIEYTAYEFLPDKKPD